MFFLTGDNKHFPSNNMTKGNTVVSSLEIGYIEHEDDSVNYSCVGTNSEGEKRDSVEIKILGKAVLSYFVYFMVLFVMPLNNIACL